MFVKLVTLAICLASAKAVYNGPLAGGKPADLYPAGVSPQACPNFPNCANPAVAANPNAPGGLPWGSQPQQQWAGNNNQWNGAQNNWNSAPQNNWNAPAVPQWNPNNQNALDRGEYVGDGDWHGEGLAEALAPGYENQGWSQGWNNNGNNQNNWAAQPQHPPAGLGAIPAGVDPGSCPNYPFCN
jgi:hypothetical protein